MTPLRSIVAFSARQDEIRRALWLHRHPRRPKDRLDAAAIAALERERAEIAVLWAAFGRRNVRQARRRFRRMGWWRRHERERCAPRWWQRLFPDDAAKMRRWIRAVDGSAVARV